MIELQEFIICSGYDLQIFSELSFHFLDFCPWKAQMFLILIKSNLSDFFFSGLCFGVICKNTLPNPRSQMLTLTFSSRSFTVLAVKFLIYFELIFICGIRQDFSSFFCMQISGYPLSFVEKTILLSLIFLETLVKNQLNIKVRVNSQTLNSIPLMYMSVLMLVQQSFHYIALFFN